MSERQSRIKRKNEPEKVEKKSKGSAVMNTVITLIIVVFLGLAGYALKDNIKALLPEKPVKETTVADIIKEKDMTLEEFLTEYGLGEDSEVTEETTEAVFQSKLTVANYAKYEGKTAEELLEEYGIEGAEDDMLWTDAYGLMPMGKYAEQMGMTFEDLQSQGFLPEGVTETTTLNEAQEMLEAEQAAAEAAEAEVAEAEETEEETEETGETEESEESEESEETEE